MPIESLGVVEGVIFFLCGIGFIFLIKPHIDASCSFIDVYSGGIIGKDMDKRNFELLFWQIQHIEIQNKIVNIHSNYTIYKCFTANAGDIGKCLFYYKNSPPI